LVVRRIVRGLQENEIIMSKQLTGSKQQSDVWRETVNECRMPNDKARIIGMADSEVITI